MIFTTKKGEHYSDKKLYKFFHILCRTKQLSYKIIFDESAKYIDLTVDKFDVNKLFGISIGTDHHIDSARFGWNYLDGKICIYSYCYVDGVRSMSLLTMINPYKEYVYTITNNPTNYLFTITGGNTPPVQGFVMKTKNNWLRRKLWPYFGGNKTSPQDIRIEFN